MVLPIDATPWAILRGQDMATHDSFSVKRKQSKAKGDGYTPPICVHHTYKTGEKKIDRGGDKVEGCLYHFKVDVSLTSLAS